MSWFSAERGPQPVYVQVRDKVKELVGTGRLPAGTRVPPTRALARILGVSRNSVLAAYEDLTARGLLESRGRIGTYVTAPEPGPGERARDQEDRVAIKPDDPWSRLSLCHLCIPGEMLLKGDSGKSADREVMLSDATPAFDGVSARRFRMCLNYVLTNSPVDLLTADNVERYLPLRAWLASYMTERGVSCTENNVLIADGYLESLSLVCRALIRPGDTVLVEDPCASSNISFLFCSGAKIHAVPVNQTGIDLAALEEMAASLKPKLVCVTPVFHDPTGAVMPPEARRDLLECAERNDFLILENGFTDEFCYSGRLISPLKAQDTCGRVLYAGSLGRLLFPEVRVGWIVASDAAIRALTPVKHCMDLRTSTVLQAACYEFCRWGYLGNHILRMRKLYIRKRDAMAESLRNFMPEGVSWHLSAGGPIAWLTLPPGLKSPVLYEKSRQAGVHVGPGTAFFLDETRGDPYLRLAYSRTPENEIALGVEILGQVIRDLLTSSARN
jgi:DNA-binding transcriptional MocR family regulator